MAERLPPKERTKIPRQQMPEQAATERAGVTHAGVGGIPDRVALGPVVAAEEQERILAQPKPVETAQHEIGLAADTPLRPGDPAGGVEHGVVGASETDVEEVDP